MCLIEIQSCSQSIGDAHFVQTGGPCRPLGREIAKQTYLCVKALAPPKGRDGAVQKIDYSLFALKKYVV
jgi:hypothetical protein